MKFSWETKNKISLVEVLVIVAIIATAAGLLVPAAAVVRRNANSYSNEPVPYEVRVIRPDGQTHTTFVVRRHFKPQVVVKDGCLTVETDEFMNNYVAPSGWQIEVEAMKEKP